MDRIVGDERIVLAVIVTGLPASGGSASAQVIWCLTLLFAIVVLVTHRPDDGSEDGGGNGGGNGGGGGGLGRPVGPHPTAPAGTRG